MRATKQLWRFLTATGAVAGVLTALAAAPASAVVVVSQTGGTGGTLTLAGDGAGDWIQVTYSDLCVGGCVRVEHWGIAASTQVQPGSGCAYFNEYDYDQGVACADSNVVTGDLGAGNDTLTLYPSYAYDSATIHGGDGDDDLEGSWYDTPYPNRDVFYGDAGGDHLRGQAGNDELHGGDGADDLEGGTGADVLYDEGGDDQWLNGQDGNDIVDGGPGAIRSAGRMASPISTATRVRIASWAATASTP